MWWSQSGFMGIANHKMVVLPSLCLFFLHWQNWFRKQLPHMIWQLYFTFFFFLKNLTFCLQTRQRNTAPTCSCHYTCKILQNTTTHSSTNLPKNSIYSSFYVLWDFYFYWNLWQGFDYFQKVLSGNTDTKRSTSS